ncbi:MAG: FAD-dependent oxidoreductase [Candidatus Sulfobium sp.]
MKEYDVIVVGSGAGLLIVEKALAHDLSVALVDKGPLGGTCLNLGCIPSKMLIYPGDRVAEIREAGKLGVSAEVREIDFLSIMERMRNTVRKGESHIREGIGHTENLDFYEGTGYFVKDSVIEINREQIKGRKIFIAAGARPRIPSVKGIEKAEYLTNESVLQLREKPKSLIIIGGGYIGAEYAHFFSAMGVKVVLLQSNARLVPDEEPEISDLLKKEMERWMDIRTGSRKKS